MRIVILASLVLITACTHVGDSIIFNQDPDCGYYPDGVMKPKRTITGCKDTPPDYMSNTTNTNRSFR